MSIDAIQAAIRDVPDFPKPGILFKDITPILGDPALFRAAVDVFEARVKACGATHLAAIDARGFLFGAALADRLGLPMAPVRKTGKLPYKSFEESYDLEYGTATLSIHQDAFPAGARVLVIDDLLATGGTALASAHLVEKAGGIVAEIAFLVELGFLNGRESLRGYEVSAPIAF